MKMDEDVMFARLANFNYRFMVKGVKGVRLRRFGMRDSNLDMNSPPPTGPPSVLITLPAHDIQAKFHGNHSQLSRDTGASYSTAKNLTKNQSMNLHFPFPIL